MYREKEYPQRKATRLKDFDYSTAGAYFVTVCTNNRKQILSEVIKTDLTATDKIINFEVGEGLAPPEKWENINLTKE